MVTTIKFYNAPSYQETLISLGLTKFYHNRQIEKKRIGQIYIWNPTTSRLVM